MPLNCGAGEDSWKSLRQQDQTNQSTLNTHLNDWYWSWSSSILVIWCKHQTHWKIPWYWERLRAGGEESVRGWDGWMASLMQWTWIWANSGDGEGRGGLAWCSPWGCKVLYTTGWLNNKARRISSWSKLMGLSKLYLYIINYGASPGAQQ